MTAMARAASTCRVVNWHSPFAESRRSRFGLRRESNGGLIAYPWALAQLPACHPSDFRKDGFELWRGRRASLRIGANQHRPARVWPGDRDVAGGVLAVVAGLVADLPVLRQATRRRLLPVLQPTIHSVRCSREPCDSARRAGSGADFRPWRQAWWCRGDRRAANDSVPARYGRDARPYRPSRARTRSVRPGRRTAPAAGWRRHCR